MEKSVDMKKDTGPSVSHLLNPSFVTGKFDPPNHPDFIEIESLYASRSGMYMVRPAYRAFVSMYDSAQVDGISLRIVSATRNFAAQKSIWERKWSGNTILSDGTRASDIKDPSTRALKILLYSSMPGTSRHHWGTDIDLNQLNNKWFEDGAGKALYEWMTANAAKFGFCQPYQSKKTGRTGYEEEKWHWSYRPVAKQLTNFWADSLTNSVISGFEGSEVASELDILNNYVLGITEDCRSVD